LNRSMFYVRTRNKYRDLRMQVKECEASAAVAPGEERLTRIPEYAVRTFEQHMRSLVAIAKSENAMVVIPSFATLHDPRMEYSRHEVFEQLSELQKDELRMMIHFTPGLTLDAVFDGINRFNKVLRQIAFEEGVLWIDNASLIPHEDRYFVDRVHFTKEGGDRMARNLLQGIVEQLGQR